MRRSPRKEKRRRKKRFQFTCTGDFSTVLDLDQNPCEQKASIAAARNTSAASNLQR
jgi:hypothetical protein